MVDMFRQGENPLTAEKHGKETTAGAASAPGGGEEPAGHASSSTERPTAGRPRKPRFEQRAYHYTVSVNEAERALVEAGAEAAKLRPAVYLRQLATGAKLGKRRDDVLYHRLSRLGVRLQTLARRAEAEGRSGAGADLEALLKDVLEPGPKHLAKRGGESELRGEGAPAAFPGRGAAAAAG